MENINKVIKKHQLSRSEESQKHMEDKGVIDFEIAMALIKDIPYSLKGVAKILNSFYEEHPGY